MDGKDSRILDLDPELSLELQLEEHYSHDPKSRHSLRLEFEDTSGARRKTPGTDTKEAVLKIAGAFEAEYNKTLNHMKQGNHGISSKRGG
jgi:hypothetical protein